MYFNIVRILLFYFLSLKYCFCCKKCFKNKNEINDNKFEKGNDNKDKDNNKDDDKDDNCKNVEIIKNDDVYVKKFINRVNGEIARKIYIFENTFKNKKEEEDFLKSEDPKLKDGYFDKNYLKFYDYLGNIVYVLFDKKTDDIICLLAINDLDNEKITINNIDVYPQKTICISMFQCHYKYRNKGYGKLLMLYVLQQFPKKTGFELAVQGDRNVMTQKKLSEVYNNFGFQLSKDIEYNPEKDRIYCPNMAFIKNDDNTYYKNKPVKVIIEEK